MSASRAVRILADHWQRARDPPIRRALHAALVDALPDGLRTVYMTVAAAGRGGIVARAIARHPHIHRPSLSQQLAALRRLRLIALQARYYWYAAHLEDYERDSAASDRAVTAEGMGRSPAHPRSVHPPPEQL